MKLKLLAGAMALALIGCSQQNAEQAASADAAPAAEAASDAAAERSTEAATPGIS
ncbi:MAG: BMP family ABC transporter substrate-binding protein, partial [Sphingopyxis sp.]|nr:BMP family ABC transporter substrate-binding protein [Sphingopyxis sp.]